MQQLQLQLHRGEMHRSPGSTLPVAFDLICTRSHQEVSGVRCGRFRTLLIALVALQVQVCLVLKGII